MQSFSASQNSKIDTIYQNMVECKFRPRKKTCNLVIICMAPGPSVVDILIPLCVPHATTLNGINYDLLYTNQIEGTNRRIYISWHQILLWRSCCRSQKAIDLAKQWFKMNGHFHVCQKQNSYFLPATIVPIKSNKRMPNIQSRMGNPFLPISDHNLIQNWSRINLQHNILNLN